MVVSAGELVEKRQFRHDLEKKKTGSSAISELGQRKLSTEGLSFFVITSSTNNHLIVVRTDPFFLLVPTSTTKNSMLFTPFSRQRGAEIVTDRSREVAHINVCSSLGLIQVHCIHWQHLQKIPPSWSFQPTMHTENAYFALISGERRHQSTIPVRVSNKDLFISVVAASTMDQLMAKPENPFMGLSRRSFRRKDSIFPSFSINGEQKLRPTE